MRVSGEDKEQATAFGFEMIALAKAGFNPY